MGMSSGSSCLLATCLFVVLFAAMQVYRSHLASSQLMTVIGGYLGSILFILTLTIIGNFESNMFGRGFQTKLFPEVVISFAVALLTSGLIHRVCVTTCFMFSLVALYYMNRISVKVYGVSQPVVTAVVPEKKKRK